MCDSWFSGAPLRAKDGFPDDPAGALTRSKIARVVSMHASLARLGGVGVAAVHVDGVDASSGAWFDGGGGTMAPG